MPADTAGFREPPEMPADHHIHVYEYTCVYVCVYIHIYTHIHIFI